ncbi:MAG: DUF839 domain-containing protein [Hyphomicrobiales bacterium]|nr:DUF839 domain-containing protein [Hyphomicrobiales bacterium]
MKRFRFGTGVVALLLTSIPTLPGLAEDFGALIELQLVSRSAMLFGIDAPLTESAASIAGKTWRQPEQPAGDHLLAAAGLNVAYVTRSAADWFDQMLPLPEAAPTHLIGCVESQREEIGTNADGSVRLNPSVQRISLADGSVETMLTGMNRCDGIRATPWGTVIVAEETEGGGVYELYDPLTMANEVVIERESGLTSNPDRVAKRPMLPAIAWEGLAVLDTGVVYGGDELRPGEIGPDRDGGTIYKFIPAAAHPGGAIARLADSPLTSGRTYALQISCLEKDIRFGQGCEFGNGGWLAVDPASARTDGEGLGATAYYRPEDLHAGPAYQGPGVRFCWANTGRPEAGHFGQVLCAIDREPMLGGDDTAAFTVTVEPFILGDEDFNSFDNLAFQPGTGALFVAEDARNGDVFACLQDGADRDLLSDGCVKVLSIKDGSAEPSGIVFSPDGTTRDLVLQHSDDSDMPDTNGGPTDDVFSVSGFRVQSPE